MDAASPRGRSGGRREAALQLGPCLPGGRRRVHAAASRLAACCNVWWRLQHPVRVCSWGNLRPARRSVCGAQASRPGGCWHLASHLQLRVQPRASGARDVTPFVYRGEEARAVPAAVGGAPLPAPARAATPAPAWPSSPPPLPPSSLRPSPHPQPQPGPPPHVPPPLPIRTPTRPRPGPYLPRPLPNCAPDTSLKPLPHHPPHLLDHSAAPPPPHLPPSPLPYPLPSFSIRQTGSQPDPHPGLQPSPAPPPPGTPAGPHPPPAPGPAFRKTSWSLLPDPLRFRPAAPPCHPLTPSCERRLASLHGAGCGGSFRCQGRCWDGRRFVIGNWGVYRRRARWVAGQGRARWAAGLLGRHPGTLFLGRRPSPPGTASALSTTPPPRFA